MGAAWPPSTGPDVVFTSRHWRWVVAIVGTVLGVIALAPATSILVEDAIDGQYASPLIDAEDG